MTSLLETVCLKSGPRNVPKLNNFENFSCMFWLSRVVQEHVFSIKDVLSISSIGTLGSLLSGSASHAFGLLNLRYVVCVVSVINICRFLVHNACNLLVNYYYEKRNPVNLSEWKKKVGM